VSQTNLLSATYVYFLLFLLPKAKDIRHF
jgi:hypothetical protein